MICESDECIQVAHVLPSKSRFVKDEERFTSGAKHRVFAKPFIPKNAIS
jgi:hypothetical protein